MSRARPNEAPMPEPLAYFITWGTYGTWLPGDERGWVEYRRGWQLPDPIRKLEAEVWMSENACWLDREQRRVVEQQISETSAVRGWTLHAVNCRTNHVHVVVTAPGRNPKIVRSQLKAWCTRRLKELEEQRMRAAGGEVELSKIRDNWWAERGSQGTTAMTIAWKLRCCMCAMAKIDRGNSGLTRFRMEPQMPLPHFLANASG